jgi:hypothetical protein
MSLAVSQYYYYYSCIFRTASNEALEEHVQQHALPPPAPKPFLKCLHKGCGFTCRNKADLEKHMTEHDVNPVILNITTVATLVIAFVS